MSLTRSIDKASVALFAITLVLVCALGLVLIEPRSIMKEQTTTDTTTITSTTTPTQTTSDTASDSFAQHLLLFSSRNVSAILSGYEPSANVTWENLPCLGGIYPIAGNNGNFTQGLDIFFGNNKVVLGFQTVFVGNLTRTTMTRVSNGSVLLNSTFGIVGLASTGNFTATVSAQDSYTYSTTRGTWLISQETWHFLTYDIPPNALLCTF
jgi:hypothetical protein